MPFLQFAILCVVVRCPVWLAPAVRTKEHGGADKFRSALERKGYDGIIIRGSEDAGFEGLDQMIAFNPDQIRWRFGGETGMADGGSLSDIGFSTLAPGLSPAERDALVDPLTGMPRTRNLGEILTGNAAPEVPGYTPGSQLNRWFPGGVAIDAWRPSILAATSTPASDPAVIVPSTASEVLGDIRGGEGRSGPAGVASAGNNYGPVGEIGSNLNAGSRGSAFGGLAGSALGLGLVGGLAGNAYGTTQDRNAAQAALDRAAAVLGVDAPALPGSLAANMMGNWGPVQAINSIAGLMTGKTDPLGLTTQSDLQSAIAATPIGGLIGTVLGLEPYSTDDYTGWNNAAVMSALSADPNGSGFGPGHNSGWEGSAFVGSDYGSRGVAPGDTAVAAFGKVGGTEGYGGGAPDGGGLGQGSQGEGTGQGGSGANRNGGLIGYAGGGAIGLASGGDLPSGSYILPADTVNGHGNGSTLAGARHLGMALGGRLVDGPGDGRSDDIPFRGPGGREIRLSNGEMIIPPAGVQAAGGADNLDRMVMQTRKKRRRAMSAFGRPAR